MNFLDIKTVETLFKSLQCDYKTLFVLFGNLTGIDLTSIICICQLMCSDFLLKLCPFVN